MSLAFGLTLALVVLPAEAQNFPPPSPNVSVFAMGLDNPRGLKWGPDGSLYVAEGGRGGAASTAGRCPQVVAPVGPYTGGATTGRISKISPAGQRTTVVDNLPSSQTSQALGSLVSGVADVEFVGDTLYALLDGAGCSHGVADVPNAVVQVNADGTWKSVADLGAFEKANPVKNPEPDDFEPDGTWYSLMHVGDDLYAVEPNHGELDKITRQGQVSRVADVSASQGHVVPTAGVAANGAFYVGDLTTFPVQVGAAKLFKISPDGQVSAAVTGLTMVTGLAMDKQGRWYALEGSTVNMAEPTPATGKVVRTTSTGELETVAQSLVFPTGMAFGPDGALYVSTFGFGFGPGMGQVVRIDVAPDTEGPPAASARDGQNLLMQSPATRAAFLAVWGNQGATRWVQEHEGQSAR